MKYQRTSGSIEEKLQTCDFKNKQWNKIANALGLEAKYMYLLSNWYDSPKYKDVLEYISTMGCQFFFDEIPLEVIGIETTKVKHQIRK